MGSYKSYDRLLLKLKTGDFTVEELGELQDFQDEMQDILREITSAIVSLRTRKSDYSLGDS